jgi:hypothetical protein
MKILKNIPVPVTYSCFEPLLKMEIGDCVEFTNKRELNSASTFMLSKSFRVRQKTISKREEPYLARMWRVE